MNAKRLLALTLSASMALATVPVLAQTATDANGYGTATVNADGSVTLNFGENSITQSSKGSIITDSSYGVLRPDNLKGKDNVAILTLPEIDLSTAAYDKVDLLAACKNDVSVSIKVGGTEVAKFDEVNNGSWNSFNVNTADLITTSVSGNVTMEITHSNGNGYCGNYVSLKFYGSSGSQATQSPDVTTPPTDVPSVTKAPSEDVLPYLDTSLSFEERAADLVSRMTLEEKVSQLGKDAPAIERLGVSKYGWWKECLHGVARQGVATAFPTSLSLSNTWNRDLIYRVADVTSTEARGKNNRYNLSYYTPTINMARDPRWGRNDETYGEDPYLTGELGTQFVKGMQGDDPKYTKIIATIKHFLANNNETNRRGGSSVMTEYNLRNYYAKVFQNVAEAANPGSVMSSYNATTVYRNGELLYNYLPSAANSYILTDLLRRNWDFDGYVTTDCGAGEDITNRVAAYQLAMLGSTTEDKGAYIANALLAGMDLECNLGGGNMSVTYGVDSVKLGYMTEEELETCIYHLFLQRFKTGEFDDTSAYRDINASVLETDEHVAVAEEAAEESWVLLKNDDNILPATSAKNVAVVGSLANELVLGDYAGSPTKNSTPVEGMTAEFAKQGATVNHLGAVADDEKLFNLKSITFVLKNGKTRKVDLSKATITKGMSLSNGALVDVTPQAAAVIKNVNFLDVVSVQAEMATGSRMGGSLNIAYGNGGPTVASVMSQATSDLNTYTVCEAAYTGEDGGYNATSDMYISASPAVEPFSVEAYKEELDAADIIVAYVGTIPKQDGLGESDSAESNDRESIDIPSHQAHVFEIASAYPNKTVVAMSTAGQMNVEPIMNNAKAILWTSYNGQTQGTALGKVLTGQSNPSGKLTTTWYKNDDLKKTVLANRTKQKIDGIEGNYTDYNIQPTDTHKGITYQYYTGTPVYPFGYGLSYTNYEYSNMTIDKTAVDANGTVKFTVDVKNAGDVAGKEVVQLYISHPQTDANTPDRQLKGFEKVELAPGETKTVEFTLNVKDLALYQESVQKLVMTEGEYTAVIGKNAADTALSKKFNVTGTLASTLKTVKAMPDGVTVHGLICEDGSELESKTKINANVSAVMSDEEWAEGYNVVYTSSNNSVASVDTNGVVTSGAVEGVATITASVTIDGVVKTDSFPVVNELLIKPSSSDIEAAKSELKKEYDKLPTAAYTDTSLSELKNIYDNAIASFDTIGTKDDLTLALAKAVNDLNSVSMDKLTESYTIESVNPAYIEKGTIDYREGGIEMYNGAEGTVTEYNPYSPIALVAKDANGNAVENVVWTVKKFDDSKRKVAQIDNKTGELTIYGNGIIQITAADIDNLTCARLMVHVNMQIEGEYADEGNGVALNDTQKGASGGYNVGNTGNAWYEYKSVKLSNLESIVARVAGKNSGTIYISLENNSNPENVIAQANVSSTGGWSSWSEYDFTLNNDVIQNAVLSGLLDTYGCTTVYVQSNGINFDYFRLNYIENNDEIPYIIEKTLNKTNGRIKATLKYRGSTLAGDVSLVAEVLNSDGSVASTNQTTVCGTGEYEIASGAAQGDTVKLTIRDLAGNDLSESVKTVYKEPVDSEFVVYMLDSNEYNYSDLTGGNDGEAYNVSVNGLSGYGGWVLKNSSSSYTYTDVNEKTYEYSFTKSWQAGTGNETKRSLYFTPKSKCRVTAVFNGAKGRDMYISQNGTKLATGLGCGQTIGVSAEITDISSPVYVYGGSSNKQLYVIIVEYYGVETVDPTTTPSTDPTATPSTDPTATPSTNPTVETSVSYSDGVVSITSGKSGNAVLVHASYDNGRLSGVSLTTVELVENDTVTLDKNDVVNGDKLMLWDSAESMKPIAQAYVVAESGKDVALQYTTWGSSTMVLTENDMTGESKVWSILPGDLWLEIPIEYFAQTDVDYNYGDKFKINTLAEYKDRLYAGCDDGLVIVLTECSKCYKLKKAADFDIKEMQISDGYMQISDGMNETTIDMSVLGGDEIEANEALVLADDGAVLIDVRSAEEFAEKSYEGSVNVPVDEIKTGLEAYDTDTVIIFYCGSGVRAQKALETAKEMGYTNVYNLGSIDKLL